jgi:RecA-family ATPase
MLKILNNNNTPSLTSTSSVGSSPNIVATPTPITNLFISVGDLLTQPDKDNWLIKNYLELDSTTLLYGASGTGKSFVSVDMACSIATGTSWQGHDTEEGAVFYIAGEGHSGFKKRFRAWQQENNVTLQGKPLFLSQTTIGLPDDTGLNKLIHDIDLLVESTGHHPKLIILDTLARCLIGDENFAKDIGGFVQALDTIRQKYGCCVLTVHHTGHKEASRARGSSALKAAMDTELSLIANKGTIELSVTKQKNHESADSLHFKLEQVDLGNELNSAVLTSTVKSNFKNAVMLNKNELVLLTALQELHDATPRLQMATDSEDSESVAIVQSITIKQWRELAYKSLTQSTPKSKKDTFTRSLTRLVDCSQVVKNSNGSYSLLHQATNATADVAQDNPLK